MNKLFNRIFWHNNTTPALNETNLNAMSKGIDDIDNRVVDLAGDIMETIPQLEEDLETAQELIEDLEGLNEHTPYIGANGNWWVWNTTTKEYEDSGVDASISVQIADITMLAPSETPYVTNTGTSSDPIFHLFIPRGTGVQSVAKTSTSGLTDTYTMTFTDSTTYTYSVVNGKGISSISKTSTSGLVDTYTITYNDNTTTTFTVTNGKSAYQAAQEAGYSGTESEFNTMLASVQTYASSASQSATAAEGSAEDAEAWAVGTRDGSPVPSTDPAYHNNAKYWSDEAQHTTTLDGLSDVTITSPQNNDALVYDSATQSWKNGSGGGGASTLSDLTDTAIATPSAGQALVYSSVGKWTNVTLPSASGDMRKAVYDPDDDGIIGIAQGGTGNADGYIRTGLANNTTPGLSATAEGSGNKPTGTYSHTEGQGNTASGDASHSEGEYCSSTSVACHSEGYITNAKGTASHSEGRNTTATGNYSHSEGFHTTAGYAKQHVQGTYNDNKSDTAFEIGWGTSANPKNVFEVYNDGYLSFDNGVNKIKFGVDANGRYGYIKAGADTVYPFKNEISVSNITPTRTSSNTVLSFTYTDRPSYFAIVAINTIYACWSFVSFEWGEILDAWTNKKAVWHARTTSSSTKSLRDDYSSYLSITEDTNNKTITITSSSTSYKFNATDYIVQAVAST